MRWELLALLLLGSLAAPVAAVAAAATALHVRTYSAGGAADLGPSPLLLSLSLGALLIGPVGSSGPIARAAWGRDRWLCPRRVVIAVCAAMAGYSALQVPVFFALKKGIDINRNREVPGRYAEMRNGEQVRVLPPDEERVMFNREVRFWTAGAMTFSYFSLACLLGSSFGRWQQGGRPNRQESQGNEGSQ